MAREVYRFRMRRTIAKSSTSQSVKPLWRMLRRWASLQGSLWQRRKFSPLRPRLQAITGIKSKTAMQHLHITRLLVANLKHLPLTSSGIHGRQMLKFLRLLSTHSISMSPHSSPGSLKYWPTLANAVKCGSPGLSGISLAAALHRFANVGSVAFHWYRVHWVRQLERSMSACTSQRRRRRRCSNSSIT